MNAHAGRAVGGIGAHPASPVHACRQCAAHHQQRAVAGEVGRHQISAAHRGSGVVAAVAGAGAIEELQHQAGRLGLRADAVVGRAEVGCFVGGRGGHHLARAHIAAAGAGEGHARGRVRLVGPGGVAHRIVVALRCERLLHHVEDVAVALRVFHGLERQAGHFGPFGHEPFDARGGAGREDAPRLAIVEAAAIGDRAHGARAIGRIQEQFLSLAKFQSAQVQARVERAHALDRAAPHATARNADPLTIIQRHGDFALNAEAQRRWLRRVVIFKHQSHLVDRAQDDGGRGHELELVAGAVAGHLFRFGQRCNRAMAHHAVHGGHAGDGGGGGHQHERTHHERNRGHLFFLNWDMAGRNDARKPITHARLSKRERPRSDRKRANRDAWVAS